MNPANLADVRLVCRSAAGGRSPSVGAPSTVWQQVVRGESISGPIAEFRAAVVSNLPCNGDSSTGSG